MSEVTRILSANDDDGPHTVDQLLPPDFDDLSKLAAAKYYGEISGQLLNATALVHEVLLALGRR